MVVFICNHCGESLKKQVVDRHVSKCRRDINVSCMDCLKDFPGKAYEAHTTCITEAEKYSGKDYVPKPSTNKGAKKQENWVGTVRAITETKRDLPSGIMSVFEKIQRCDNIPRKMKGFMNFFQNSAKHIRRADVEAAWALIEEEVKRSRQQPQPTTTSADQQKPAEAKEKESDKTVPHNGAAVKRKLNEEELEESQPKKKKTKKPSTNGNHSEEGSALLGNETNGTNGTHREELDETVEPNGVQKFRWTEVIQSVLISKDNQMKLKKLKKKVLKRYQQFVGGETDEQQLCGKFEKKFNKKIQKANYVVENDTVRLVA